MLLAVAVPAHADLSLRFALAVYAAGLMAMLACSALYNLADEWAASACSAGSTTPPSS